jgi:hypothetical protein
MRRLLSALILAGGAVALPACGPVGYDVGVGADYPLYGYGYYDGYYPYYGNYYGRRAYYGHRYGYYGHPYNRGVVVGRGWGAYGHTGAAIHPAAPMAHPAAPMSHPMAAPHGGGGHR